MSDSIRVLVADDHAIVREGIRTVLVAAPDIEVVGEAADGSETVRLVSETRPDVAILDISMPGGSGLDVARQLRDLGPGGPRILMLSVYDDAEYVLEAVRAGANGYLRKDSSPRELRDAVRAVAGGGEYFSPTVAGRLSAALRDGAERAAGPLERLTDREREVLVHVTSGRTSKEIASRLGISHRTVESHRENLMKKLGIESVAELTKFALKSGLIPE